LGAEFTPTGAAAPTLVQSLTPCGPTTTVPDFCGGAVAVSNSKLNGPWGSGLNGTWDLRIQNPTGTAIATFPLPTTSGLSLTPLPFPSSVTITNSADGVTPMISWTLPSVGGGTFMPNGFAVLIFDRSTPLLPNGTHDVIYQTTLPPSATSFQVPESANLQVGDQYTIGLQIITTRDGSPAGPSSDFKARSYSFFDFTPQMARTFCCKDLNGDGHADIVWRDNTGEVYAWLMNGLGISSQGSPGSVGNDWQIAGVGDFNGDGRADILWRNTTSGEVYEWLLNGTNLIGAGSPGSVGNDWQIE
jgi:FG-GAP-like repeat